MPVDDSFLAKEAAKRRAISILIVLLLLNCLVCGVLFAAGFRFEDPTTLFFFVVGEAAVCGLAYYFVVSRYDRKDSKPPRRR